MCIFINNVGSSIYSFCVSFLNTLKKKHICIIIDYGYATYELCDKLEPNHVKLFVICTAHVSNLDYMSKPRMNL